MTNWEKFLQLNIKELICLINKKLFKTEKEMTNQFLNNCLDYKLFAEKEIQWLFTICKDVLLPPK